MLRRTSVGDFPFKPSLLRAPEHSEIGLGLTSGVGTKRTNRIGLAMSVNRVDRKWLTIAKPTRMTAFEHQDFANKQLEASPRQCMFATRFQIKLHLQRWGRASAAPRAPREQLVH